MTRETMALSFRREAVDATFFAPMSRLSPISPSRRSSVALASLIFLCTVATPLHAQGRGGGGGGRGGGRGRFGGGATVDLATAQKTLLEKDPPLEKDFSQLVQSAMQESTNRKLPSFMEDPENTYGPEQLSFREEVYGPLRKDPRTRELLRSLARKPAVGFDFSIGTAAMVLADAPDADDLAAIYAGYQATPPDQRASVARQLGRAIAKLKEAQPRPPLVDETLARLKSDAIEGRAGQRGAAIEGLFRSGDAEEAVRVLRPLFDGTEHDALETVTVLQACSRLFQRKDLDPFLRARAVVAAENAVQTLLASQDEVAPTQVIAGEGRTLRAAIAFLQDAGGPAEFELFLRCLEDPRAQKLMGMDGLQNLRFALQRQRNKVTPELGARLDERWLAILLAAGNRLFSLEEEPMEPEEQRAFWDARDLRYNALAYFCDQFQRTPAVRERLGKENDLPALLATLYRAKEDVNEGEAEGGEDGGDGGDSSDGAAANDGSPASDVVTSSSRFIAVADKLENRVLALQLLALIQREWNRDPGGLDLFAEAYAILSAEIQAPVMAVADVVTFRASTAPDRVLDIPVGHPPDDTFVQGAACQTIANLGFVVHTSPTGIKVEPDPEHPWPWPAK
jgi:hypothetical protein